ncbi:GntR family transcriptional regulator [Paenibacillus sp. MSJ-34]|uniref:GntR family transcriptional regulator n=1 Tax=Paenibacillus sp. MSJ-34 TaxID=2841529 RepID=UPI001C0FEA7D|nr:GntR family transcriptional regulator [Paenibacillus sp. MSJ-34]MBU5445213.1 GntR family transcriptional regulator [Paenibacillus sp. MSJ-34]
MNRPLYQRIQYDIIRRIQSGELAEGDLVPSEKDLSLQYGVSRITAKNALNGLVERGLLSRYRGKGTFVRTSPEAKRRRTFPTGDNKTIAVILPAMKTKNDQRLLDGLEKYCTEAHYNILVRITRESQDEEARAIEQFRETGVDGFIIFPVERENYNDGILRLSLDRVPLVLVTFDDADLEGIPHIRQQEDEISRLAVELLSEQLHGRFDPRRITVPIHYKRALEEV